MPASDSPDVLVARFLLANNYHETFAAFVRETNLTPDSITTRPTDLTIEKILEEKKLYDLAVRFEKLNVAAEDVVFAVPHPATPTTLTTLSTASNILSVTLTSLVIPADAAGPQPVIISTSADKLLRVYSARAPHALLHTSPVALHAGPILSVVVVAQRWLVTGSMAGDIAVSNVSGEVVQRWEGHKKFVVKLVASHILPAGDEGGPKEEEEEEEGIYLAAASYDKTLSIHKLWTPRADASDRGQPRLEFVQSIAFSQTVEDVIFTADYNSTSPFPLLISTIRDSAYLHIYSLSPPSSPPPASSSQHQPIFTLISKPPLNSTATTWLTYTPTSLTLNPKRPHLLALITSSLPSPKLLIYNLATGTIDSAIPVPTTLSAYSTGVVAWRGDVPASGLWINSDDGVIRGVELRTGAVKAELQAHDGRKVRCLAAGMIPRADDDDDDSEADEVLVSGGFDGSLKVWRV
ncbi:hypothetical protein DRE_04049 [Drechslerella stenobrocha 248]|uniref:Uncharacterized protein n=1 Tax=Drechslerella stenobrocha 248 TaxID=1043628 RepID=W7HTP1_9PEZI|nr:hypothetical protein DRE_04049 [Drechslerella stenobrocha 248]